MSMEVSVASKPIPPVVATQVAKSTKELTHKPSPSPPIPVVRAARCLVIP
jgi:hypothetical protein